MLIRSVLDKFYQGCGIFAALSMMAIMIIVILQIIARVLQTNIPSSDDISGYLVAWTSFFGLAYAMAQNSHVRVELFINMLNQRYRRWLSVMVACLGLLVVSCFAFYVFLLVHEAFAYDDLTSGYLPIPLWWVQTPYFLGVFALWVSVADKLFCLLLLDDQGS